MEPHFPTDLSQDNNQRQCFFCFDTKDFHSNNDNDGVKEEPSSKTNYEVSSCTASVSSVQVQTLFRYLGIDFKKLDMVRVCQTCEKILESFSTLFRIWEEMDILTSLSLEPLTRQMEKWKNSNRDPPKLQEIVRSKCLAKTRKYSPYIKVQKVEIPPPVAPFSVHLTGNELEDPAEPGLLLPFELDDDLDPFHGSDEDGLPEQKPEVEQKLVVDWDSSTILKTPEKKQKPIKNRRPTSKQLPVVIKRNSKHSRQFANCFFDKFVGTGPPPSSLPFPITPEAVEGEACKSLEKTRLAESNYSYTCKKCGKKFLNLQYFRDHFRSEHLLIEHCCRECGQTFKSQGNGFKHWNLCHSQEKSKDKDNSGPEATVKDQQDGTMLNHTFLELKCEPCNRIFYQEADYKLHLKLKHSSSKAPPLFKFDCPNCDKSCRTASGLYQHRKLCGVPEHLRYERKSGAGYCKICKKSFLQLNIHQRDVHMEVRKYRCDICGIAYKRSSHLKYHQRSAHLRIRYECKEPGCGKDFANKYVLTDHMKKEHRR